MAADVRASSLSASAFERLVIVLWSHVWLPITWPSAIVRRTSAGYCLTCTPSSKNVARMCALRRMRSTAGVCGPGPSSNVSATRRGVRGPLVRCDAPAATQPTV